MEHGHVFDGERRALWRVCDGCHRALVSADPRRWRPVPRRWLWDPDLRASWAEWQRIGLTLPVGALVRDSLRGWVARAPHGDEWPVDEGAVAEFGARTPLVAEARPDVEAIVVGGRPDPQLWLVPRDISELLATHTRRHWRGTGAAAWLVLDTFFDALRAGSRPVVRPPAPTESGGRSVAPTESGGRSVAPTESGGRSVPRRERWFARWRGRYTQSPDVHS